MNARGLRTCIAGTVLMLVAAACGGGGTETGDSASPGGGAVASDGGSEPFSQDFEQATVMVVSNNTHLAAMAAAEQGFWLQHGLDVNLEVLDSGAEITTAVGAGEAEFGGINAGTTAPPARAGGLDIAVVVPYMNDALDVADVGRVSLIARADSGIDPDDPTATLAGRKIGVLDGSTTDQYIRSYLERNDLTVEDVEFVNMPVPDMAVALQQGLVDAVVPWEPYVSQILREQGDDAVIVERGGDYVADVIGLATLDSLVEERPELVESLILGILEGAQFVRQNPEEAAEILTSYIGGVQVEDVVEGNAETSYDPRVSVCTEQGVMDAAQQLIDAGEIEHEPFELQELLNVDILTRLTEENPQFFDDLEPMPEDLADCQ